MYAYSISLGGSYGHKFKRVELHELVRFDGVVVKDGVCGGSVGAMYRRWVDGRDYYEVIEDSINHSQWLQIKRTVKLNMNSTCPKRGEPGYDPAYKFDFIYKTLVHNVNCTSKHAESNQCGDETTWLSHDPTNQATAGLSKLTVPPSCFIPSLIRFCMLADAIHIVHECLINEIKFVGQVITRFPSIWTG